MWEGEEISCKVCGSILCDTCSDPCDICWKREVTVQVEAEIRKAFKDGGWCDFEIDQLLV